MTIGKSHRALAHRWRSTASHGCAQVCFAAAPVDRRGNRGIQWATINGGCAIQTIGMPGGRSLLLAAVVVALAATTGAAWLHEARPGPCCKRRRKLTER